MKAVHLRDVESAQRPVGGLQEALDQRPHLLRRVAEVRADGEGAAAAEGGGEGERHAGRRRRS